MIDLLEDRDIITDSEKEFINNIVLGAETNWQYGYGTSRRYPCYMHVLSPRNDANEEIPWSPYFNFFKDIIDRFLNKHNLVPNGYKVLRSALNDQINHSDEHGDIHLDYPFDNYLIIIYLNDNDKGGTNVYDCTRDDLQTSHIKGTYLFNDDLSDGKIWELPLKKHVKNEAFKIALYNGKFWHSAGCGEHNKRRTICVFAIEPNK